VSDDVTPAELRELAAAAEALAEAVMAVHARLAEAPDEPTQRTGFRLEDAAGAARDIARQLADTAGDLARVRARSACPADWGVCPDHGATLHSYGTGTAIVSRCTAPGCERRWNHDRAGLPCTEAVAYAVVDRTGERFEMCAGHALDARDRLDGGATLTPLPAAGGDR
jgi:hypothetical protein